MRDSDLRSAPPVPPRRLKRKTKPVVESADAVVEVAMTPVLRSERRSRLPPPPPPPTPPQRVQIRQRIRSAEIPPAKTAAKNSPRRSFDVCHSRRSINGAKQDVDDVDVDLRPSFSTFGTTLCLPLSRKNSGEKSATQEAPLRRSKDRARISRPNEYPPLFFTLQDFQEVMADVDNSYSRTLRNMTSFEPTPRPRRPRDPLAEVAVGGLPETPKGQVLFRVTTTNVPFEKCLSGWGDCGNDPNHFIFEDYVDRRQFPAPRCETASRKLVLFGDDTFDKDNEEESASTTRSTTRVRFLIDSPGEEVAEKNADFDSLQNIDSLPLDDDIDVSRAPADETEGEKISEDEFGDVPFNSLLNSGASSLHADPSEDSTSSRTDFQTILVTAAVEKIPEPEKPREDRVESIEPWGEDTWANSSIDEAERVRGEEASSEGKDIGEKLLVVSAAGPCAEKITCEKSPPLVKERRNSFLMNMLQGEEPKEKVFCKVVATHPKTPIRGCMVRGEEMRPSAVVEAKNKLLGELSSSFGAARLKPRTINDVENTPGISGEESDSGKKLSRDLDSVLLDSNVVKCNKVSEEPIEEKIKSNRLCDEPQTSSDYVCSQKTDQYIDKKNNKKYLQDRIVIKGIVDNADEKLVNGEKNIGQNNGGDSEKNNDKICENDDNVDSRINITKKIDDCNKVDLASISSVDKCAIVRRCNHINIDDINDDNNNNSNINNNIINNNDNNDNNAMTPVDLSYDQSPKVLSIVPGSVRSFVKFYEIRGETNVVGSNVSENYTTATTTITATTTTITTPEIRVEEVLETVNREMDNSEEKSSKDHPVEHPAEIENDIKYTIVARKEIRKRVDLTAHDQNPIANQRSIDRFTDESRRIIPSETRFSQPRLIPVKHRAIDEAIETERGKESATMSLASSSKKTATRTTPKSRNVPEKKDGSTAGETGNGVISSAENQSIQKSSTATFDGRYTFYCTV